MMWKQTGVYLGAVVVEFELLHDGRVGGDARLAVRLHIVLHQKAHERKAHLLQRVIEPIPGCLLT